MGMIEAGKLRHLIRIERPVPDNSLDGAGSGSWAFVKEVWAEVQDMLPSRAERLDRGINMSERPARVRIRYRTDITSDMRMHVMRRVGSSFVIDRTMQIVSGPAELGLREGLEFMTVEFSPSGNRA